MGCMIQWGCAADATLRMHDLHRLVGTCTLIRHIPDVTAPLLLVRVVYTRRSLSYTQLLTQTVTGQPAEEVGAFDQ